MAISKPMDPMGSPLLVEAVLVEDEVLLNATLKLIRKAEPMVQSNQSNTSDRAGMFWCLGSALVCFIFSHLLA